MEFLFFLLLIPVVLFVLPIAAWVSARRSRARVEALEAALERQQASLDRLSDVVGQLRREAKAAAAATAAPEPTPAAATPPAVPKTTPPPPRPVTPPAAERPVVPVPPASAPPVQPPPVAPTAPTGPAAQTPPVPPSPVRPPIVQRPWPERDQPRAAAPDRPAARRQEAPPPPPSRPPQPAEPPEPPRRPFDWESLVGVKLFSAIAGIALVFAAVFFLRYSVQQGWLQPPVRVLIGILVAITLLVLCELKAARRYPATANALDAAAIAILFSTFFAAHALWNLIPAGVTFGLLAMVTGLAVLLSIRRESLFIAVLGLLGGFATPALLSTGENRPIPLFAYLLLLNVGLAWVAYRNTWPVLSVLTLILTTAYQWVWVFRFMAQADITLAMGIFLVFPLVTFAGLLIARRPTVADDGSLGNAVFERTAMAAAALPLLFAAYLAAVPAYGARPGLLFGFLLLLDAGLFAIAIARRQTALHATGALATVLVTAIWLAGSYASGVRHLFLAFTSAFVVFYLAAPAIARWFSRELKGAGAASVYAAPILLVAFPVLAALEPAFAAPVPLFGTLLLLVLLCAWRAAATGQAFVYFTAAFFAVATQAVWSTEHLTVERLGTAVAIYAVFGLVTAAVPIGARRFGRALQPEGAGGLMLLASLALLFFLSLGDVAPAAIWALALLLAIVNGALFIESASARLPLVAQAGSLLSWLILATWWIRAAASVGVLPSLAVLTGLTLVTLAGHAWAHRLVGREKTSGEGARFADGLYLGLVGHLFLFFVAVNREWGLPPWPLFATLSVMTLAISTTSLLTRAPVLHAAGAIAASVIVAAWTDTAAVWPMTGIAASAAVTAFALAWIAIGGRTTAASTPAIAAAAVLFVAEFAAIAAARQGPPFGVIPLAHVVNLALILTLTWRNRWHGVSLGAAAIAWVALLEWQTQPASDWRQLLVHAGAFYALFTAYPLIVGPKAPGDREPWLTALVGAAMAFVAGRSAFKNGGLEWMIGVVPVVQGLVTAFLLRALLRLQTPGERDLGRLALVAGAALAFVTVAIPMQLEHQWITIGWALEGAALAWIYLRIPHRGLLLACAALLATVFVRLALNPAVFVYEPRGATRIFNWYLYTYAIAAAAMFLAAWWLRRSDDRVAAVLPRMSHLLPAAGGILLFLLLNIEIADYYATGPEITFRFGVTLSQDLTYTIGWLAFGLLLLAVGIYARARPARVTAVVMIAVTTFKCFLYDLRSLEGLYRVASLVGLAMSLALVALALQKYVFARQEETI